MHGNPLGVYSQPTCHMTLPLKLKDLQHGKKCQTEEGIYHNKNVIVLGDLNAALHARKEGEEECLGLQVWGKSIAPLREKEGLLPENVNRNILIELLK